MEYSSPAQSFALFLFALLRVAAATMDKVAAAGCIVAEWGCILDTTSEGMGCRTKALEVEKANADHATRTDAFFPILESLVDKNERIRYPSSQIAAPASCLLKLT